MSHSFEGTAVVARVSSVAEAVQAIEAGAHLVDAGSDEALIEAIRGEGLDVLDSGWSRCAGLAHTPAPEPLAAEPPAAGSPAADSPAADSPEPGDTALSDTALGATARDRILVEVGPAEVPAAVAAGWRTLVDVDSDDRARQDAHTAAADTAPADGRAATAGTSADTAAARAGAIAAICAWQGAHMVRTRHIAQVRRCIDMTETIKGTRPPAWAVRGLG
jgi:hypothetical protein